jgi:aromatic ring-opening dioxygenase catalytic subunit (LigB family)
MRIAGETDEPRASRHTTAVREEAAVARCAAKYQPIFDTGLDHGVFIPFKLMFPDSDGAFDVPIVEVSQDASLKPEDEYEIGKAMKALREEGILVIAGGLTVHSFEDLSSFNEKTAAPAFHTWNDKVIRAVEVADSAARKQALFDLTKEPEFRLAHPREVGLAAKKEALRS